jgi:hypothetical protein
VNNIANPNRLRFVPRLPSAYRSFSQNSTSDFKKTLKTSNHQTNMTYNSADHFNEQQTLKSAAQQASGMTQAEKAIHHQQRTRPNGPWMRSPAGYVVSNSRMIISSDDNTSEN